MGTKIKKKAKKKKASSDANFFHINDVTLDGISQHWDEWIEYLLARDQTPVTDLIFIDKDPCLLWGVDFSLLEPETIAICEESLTVGKGKWKKKKKSLYANFDETLKAFEPDAADLNTGIKSLAFCQVIDALALILSKDQWIELCEKLIKMVADSPSVDSENSPLFGQIICGELPITLAYVLPEVSENISLMNVGLDTIRSGVLELLDGDGIPHAKNCKDFLGLYASWIRCQNICESLQIDAFEGDQKLQFEWLVEQSLRFTRNDGTPYFSIAENFGYFPQLFDAGLSVSSSETDRNIAIHRFPNHFNPKGKLNTQFLEVPHPTTRSEWAEMALMRSSWASDSPRLALRFDEGKIGVELDSSRKIFDGEWKVELEFNGKPLRSTSDWSEVCWHSDDDVDCIELEMHFEKGIRLQRQFLLAHNEGFLWVADSILGESEVLKNSKANSKELAKKLVKMNYRSSVPICEGLEFEPAAETHEAFLTGKKFRMSVLPLALPEWRRKGQTQRFDGELSTNEDELRLSLAFSGSHAVIPMLFDLNSRRCKKPLTWRQLTVAERLETVHSSVAAAFRVQANDSQWIFYRSLSEQPGCRTFFGQNHACEFLAFAFDEDAEVQELLCIGE